MNIKDIRFPFSFKSDPDDFTEKGLVVPEGQITIRLDRSLIRRLAREPNGPEMAAQAAESKFKDFFGEAIQMIIRRLESSRDELVYAKAQVQMLTDHLSAAKSSYDEKNAGVPQMDAFTKVSQWILGVLCVCLLGLATNSLAMNLIQYGEVFALHPLRTYLFALSGPPALALLLKSLMSVPKSQHLKDLLVTLVIILGIASTTFFLIELSQVYPPDRSDVRVDDLIPRLDGPTIAEATVTTAPAPKPGPFYLMKQLIAEACAAAAVAYFWHRNRERFRTHVWMKSADYKYFQKERRTFEERATSLHAEIGHNEGTLSKLEHQLIVARITAIAAVRREQRYNDSVSDEDEDEDEDDGQSHAPVRPRRPPPQPPLNGTAQI